MTENSTSVRIEDMQTLSDEKGKLLNVSFEQRRRDGRWQKRTREIYDHGNAAVVLPYDSYRRTVLLTRQLRLPIFLQDGIDRSIEACAGKLEGEQAEVRMVKEIEEELGYKIKRL
jgi:GDP-mannose pyrophosphatase NudK